jgi:hypothetical protein
MGFCERWRAKARRLEREVYALYLACRDPRVPLHAKLVAAGIIAYAYTTAGGKDARVRVQRVGKLGGAEIRIWRAHERVRVKRTARSRSG